jgi:branched-chain amino acid transport system permease protein
VARRLTLPAGSGWIAAMAVAAVVALLPYFGISVVLERELLLAALHGLLVAGFNLSFGYGGQLALGQVAVFAGGAYTTAILYTHGVTELTVAIAASVAVAALIGVLTGIPGVRFEGWTLALVSFFLVVLVPNLVAIFEEQTGGVNGIPGIIGPTLFGTELDTTDLYVVVIVATAVTLLLYRNLVLSRYGQGLLVLKQSTALARSVGLAPFRIRLSAYVLGSLPAGLAGAFYAYYSTYVQAGFFAFNIVTLLLAASVIGGVRSIWAAPLAAAILVIGPEQASAFEEYSVLAYGIILILAGVGISGGLAGLGNTALRRLGGGPRAASPARVKPAADEQDRPPLAIAGAHLAAHDVAKRFGGVEALRGVDFSAKPGEITAIIGANGAGKTTLLNAISGHIPIDRGAITLGDARISGLRSDKIAQAGVTRTFQTPEIPEELTVLEVAESSRIGKRWMPPPAIALRTPGYARLRREDTARARSALEFVGLDDVQHMPAHELPLGRRRILEVARSIAAEPAVILLDEPAAGLDPPALESLRSVLDRMREAGATVVLVEHNVNFVMDVADTACVMDLGAVIATGTPDEVRRDERVLESYLGRRKTGHHTLDEPATVEAADAV